jgi:predicted alpha/beta-hydrolase family hydrolase
MILQRPPDAWAIYVVAPGAGGGIARGFMQSFADALAEQGVATLRHELRPVDPKPVTYARVREAVARAAAEDLPLFAGGKSFGGRMTSEAQAKEPLPGLRGIAFAGFPLHPPGKPATSRAEHLSNVYLPLLFMQGTRDEFASLGLLKPVVDALPHAMLHVIDGADHSLRKAVGELATAFAAWARPLAQRPSGESSSRASRSSGSR